jgi:ATP-dependent helicase HrpB
MSESSALPRGSGSPWAADLPVRVVLDDVVAASRGGAAVVVAPPGSGKTLLVPAALVDDLGGATVILVQPRRLAARAVAAQIARLRGGALGAEVGYQVRFDACTSRATRLFVETTGIVLRRLLDDISLPGTGAVVLDEFHERSVELDLVFGLLRRVRETLRPDLRVVVTSATLAAGPVAAALGGCPVIEAAGRMFPVEVVHHGRGPRRELVEMVRPAVEEALGRTPGHVLVFLPGVGEIAACQRDLDGLAARGGHDLHPLHGDLPPERQDAALAETGRRKIILATNVAETSLTIPGVTAVVDSGLARQLVVNPATGLPRLELVGISRAAADQRAGRAGRTGPGRAVRLWTEAEHAGRPAAETPEILRSDLAGPLLWLEALGEATDFPWLDHPSEEALATARQLLERLGAVDADGRVTAQGREMVRLPTHPRLGRMLIEGAVRGVLREASIAAALVSDRDPFRRAAHAGGSPRDRRQVRSRCDVADRVIALQAFHAGAAADDPALEPHPPAARAVLRAAEQLFRMAPGPLGPRSADPREALARCLLVAFPDRLARLRAGSGDRGTLVGGRGVRLTEPSRVSHEALFLAVDIDDARGEARTRLATAVERAWLDDPATAANLHSADEIVFDPGRRRVAGRRRTRWIDLVLDEAPLPVGAGLAAEAAAVLAAESLAQAQRCFPAADSAPGRFRARVRWLAGLVPDLGLPPLDDGQLASLLPDICRGLEALDDVATADWRPRLEALVGHDRLHLVDRLAPDTIALPAGRRARVDYPAGGQPQVAARIQDFFGLAESPRIADGRVAVVLQLLGPDQRPRQVTSDLAGFWRTTYPGLRRELARRYPKHAWPEDPLAAR